MKVLGPVALVIAGLLLSVLTTSCSSGGKSVESTSTTTTAAATAASPSPVVACPSSTGSPTAASTTTTTASPPTNADWTGVFERVRVELQGDGSSKKTPRQFTIVSASGNGPVTIDVPVSSSHVHRRSTGKRAHVVNGMAQVDLNPNGTASERLDSDYTHPLPVAVKVTYKLNGNTISGSQIKGKSGSVEVDYQLTNTTSKPVTVCFKGFNGKLVKQTVATPAPIIANLSFTVSKHAKSFKAEGASLAPARHGISASWTASMFEPLGPTTQTFVFTMKTRRASIPSATLLLETLNPLSISGKAPAESAAKVARAQAAVAKATAQVQSDVAAIQLNSSQHGSGSNKELASGSKKIGAGSKKKKGSGSNKSPRLNLAASSFDLPGLLAQAAALRRAHRTFTRTVNRSRTAFSTAGRRSVAELSASTSRSVDALTAAASSSVDGLTAGMSRSLDTLKTELRQSVDARSISAITASAARVRAKAVSVRRHADALRAETSRLGGRVDDLVTGLPATAQNALLEVAKLNQLEVDLDALSAAQTALPEVQSLVQDVSDAQAVAGTVSSQLSSLVTRARAVDGAVRKLQSDTVALQRSVAELGTLAVANARSRIQRTVADAVHGLVSRFAVAQARAARTMADAELSAVRNVASGVRSAKQSLLSAQQGAKQSVASAERRAERAISSAEREVDKVTASAQTTLAAAREHAEQGGKTDLAALQADANQAESAAASALAKANARYARLLMLELQAVANQLPGGDAAVTVQNGSFLYTIAGT